MYPSARPPPPDSWLRGFEASREGGELPGQWLTQPCLLARPGARGGHTPAPGEGIRHPPQQAEPGPQDGRAAAAAGRAHPGQRRCHPALLQPERELPPAPPPSPCRASTTAASPHLTGSDLNVSGPSGALGEGAAGLQPDLCLQGSSATWLHHALPKLAEIIRLQDPSAIKIEVATYATWYPDFR